MEYLTIILTVSPHQRILTNKMNEFEAQQKFVPYVAWIRECWWRGWEDYRLKLQDPLDDARARSVMIQNRAVIHATKTCGKLGGIKPFTFDSRRLFHIADCAVIQFKKLTDELKLSNNVNKTVHRFDSQIPLPGLVDLPRITTGYCPNSDHTSMSMYLVHTKSHYKNNWTINITAEPVATNVDLFEADDEQFIQKTRRVRPRRAADTEGGESAAQG